MDRNEFLSRFADLADDQLHTLRRSARLDEWPKDQSFYVEISKLFFVDDPFDIDERQRFVQILREMIYTDGRTLAALLWIADRALSEPRLYGGNGLNSLAGIWCFLQWAELNEDGKENLRGWMTRFLEEKEYLAYNAKQCLELLDSAEN
ncbi:hypothetical protein SH449x_003576 [Pirellulaceae bacterium SH449]